MRVATKSNHSLGTSTSIVQFGVQHFTSNANIRAATESNQSLGTEFAWAATPVLATHFVLNENVMFVSLRKLAAMGKK